MDGLCEKTGADARRAISTHDIALIGLMVAVIEVSKLALTSLPNIELTSFWLIMFTLFFGRRIALVVPVFILIEGCIYGFGLWWIMYLYAWPLLVSVVWIFRARRSCVFWALVSAAFGLCFGALCSIPYFFVGLGGGVAAGLRTMFSWWVAGIPWDIVHCVGNGAMMLALFNPIMRTMEKLTKQK